MSEIITIIVTVATILIILFFSLVFVKKSRSKPVNTEIDLSDFEDRVMELVSKFQHISATRLSSLENKISEMNKLLREANDTYFKLSSMLSDATKIMTELEKKSSEIDNADKRTVEHKKVEKRVAEAVNENQAKEELNDQPEEFANYKNSKKIVFPKNDRSFSEMSSEKISDLEVDSIEIKSSSKTSIEEIEKPFDLKNSSLEHKILNLSSEGLDSTEIAKKLGVGKGEVDLVLGLFKRKFI